MLSEREAQAEEVANKQILLMSVPIIVAMTSVIVASTMLEPDEELKKSLKQAETLDQALNSTRLQPLRTSQHPLPPYSHFPQQ